ncbi:hypothetical protein OJ252_826 [Cryptosporidium canis]|uniref:Uncharacterized protein n=1 Tax=Cryptosporidium canis TaxID=195482 RepID=A0ABQ8PA41_9CRYT|nr:hypothetical protein OJ252_826 [Cryptosporidium canis]
MGSKIMQELDFLESLNRERARELPSPRLKEYSSAMYSQRWDMMECRIPTMDPKGLITYENTRRERMRFRPPDSGLRENPKAREVQDGVEENDGFRPEGSRKEGIAVIGPKRGIHLIQVLERELDVPAQAADLLRELLVLDWGKLIEDWDDNYWINDRNDKYKGKLHYSNVHIKVLACVVGNVDHNSEQNCPQYPHQQS